MKEHICTKSPPVQKVRNNDDLDLPSAKRQKLHSHSSKNLQSSREGVQGNPNSSFESQSESGPLASLQSQQAQKPDSLLLSQMPSSPPHNSKTPSIQKPINSIAHASDAATAIPGTQVTILKAAGSSNKVWYCIPAIDYSSNLPRPRCFNAPGIPLILSLSPLAAKLRCVYGKSRWIRWCTDPSCTLILDTTILQVGKIFKTLWRSIHCSGPYVFILQESAFFSANFSQPTGALLATGTSEGSTWLWSRSGILSALPLGCPSILNISRCQDISRQKTRRTSTEHGMECHR